MRLLRAIVSGVFVSVLMLWVASGASTDLSKAQAQEEREFKFSARVQSAYFQYMYDEGDTVEDAKARISRTLDMAEAAGVNTIDVPVAWAGVDLGDHREEDYGDGERFRGRYIWDSDVYGHENNHLDNILREAESRGLAVNLQIEATPDWVHPYLEDRASGCGSASASPYCTYDYRFWHPPRGDEEIARFGEFMGDLAKHVKTEHPGLAVGHYKIWNEPNSQPSWEPGLGPESPGEYVELLRAAHTNVEEADPGAGIAFGGVSLNNHGYLKEYYEAARRAYPEEAEENGYFFDVLGVHPYVYPGAAYRGGQSPDLYEQTLTEKGFTTTDHFTGEEFDYIGGVNGNFLGFQKMKEVMDTEEGVASGSPGKALYFSEFGYRVPYNVSDERRALYLKRAYDLARDYDYVEGMAWFTFYQSASFEEGEMDWTTVDRGFSPSLTYRALEQATGAEASDVKLDVVMSKNRAGVYTVKPRLAGLPLSAVRRWELYVDGEMVKTQATAPITWKAADAEARKVMLAVYSADGSVWHSEPESLPRRGSRAAKSGARSENPQARPYHTGQSARRWNGGQNARQ